VCWMVQEWGWTWTNKRMWDRATMGAARWRTGGGADDRGGGEGGWLPASCVLMRRFSAAGVVTADVQHAAGAAAK
jgi:hypothetical protein